VRRCLIVLVALVAACGRASNESEAKQWSSPEPPALGELPADLAIAVTVDGAARPTITAQTLHLLKPDFTDPEHKAWLVSTLLPDAIQEGTAFAAFDNAGASVTFTYPMADNYVPVIFLTRRNEILVSAIDAKVPFPKFHGQGGRLRRPGDTTKPRLANVARIAITRPPSKL